MTTDPSLPIWTIIQQTPTSNANSSGVYVSGTQVTFRTARGTIGHVFVPESDYTAANVHRIVAERAATADAVADLTG